MGGAVISVMDFQNRRALVPHPGAVGYESRLRECGTFLREVPGTETDKCSSVFRLKDADDPTYDDISESYWGDNFLQTLRKTCRARESQTMCAYRPINRTVKEEMTDAATGKVKKLDITYLDETETLTYRQVWDNVEAFGRGLATLGIKSKANVAIYLDTCVEWFIGIYGIWSQGMVAATVYANLGEAALAYALHETNAAAILCGPNNARNLMKLMQDGVIANVPIIYNGKLPADLDTTGFDVHSFLDVLNTGREMKRKGLKAGSPSHHNDDLALIMYTSGTTGDPKGVMHSHGSLVAGLAALTARVVDILGEPSPAEQESYCAYLPMAHVMEFTVVSIFIQRGALIGFGSPRTLTDVAARPHGDLTEFKPTLLVGVPRIFDTLKKAIEAKLPAKGTVKRRVFDHAYQSRLQSLKDGFDTPFWNEKVFAVTRKLVGGRMKACLSGGGPISASTQEFVHVVLGPCVTGYGLTETVCVGVIQLAGDWETSCGGLIEPGEEIKLLDTDYYKHTDSPEPQGELCVRGSFLFRGYYKQPELTKEALDEDGWFHTGDVASITKDGKLRLVGRVKALAKNSLGEYIAMEALEAVYSGNDLLTPNGVCVLVHPNRNYITALALTDEGKAMTFAKANGIEGEWPSILEKPEFQEVAAKSLAQTAKDANRAPFECVRHVRVLADEWTPENDVLTAALKLKRRVIDVKYADTIKELFVDE